MLTLGGDGVWMVSDADGLRLSVLGIGQAAAAVPCNPTSIPQRGAGAMLTTAGLVPSWEALLELSNDAWQKSMPLGDLLAKAQALAANGYPISASQRFWLDYRRGDIHDWHGFAQAFLPEGLTPKVGTQFRQTNLARMLSVLANEGLESFRTGSIAAELALGLAAAGSPITGSDLAATSARIETPLSLRSGDWTLFAPPPPTQGATTLLIRALLDQVCGANRRPANPASRFHVQVEAVKQAFLHRAGLADPDFTDQSDALPSARHIAGMARRISRIQALHWPDQLETADTVFLAVADAKGRCVSGLQSTYFDWGSGVLVGNTGILWHNRGAAFACDESNPNGLAPGKRPFHTLNPGFAIRDDGEIILYGTQGADGQPQTLTVILDRLLADSADVSDALRSPRFLLGRTFSDSQDTLKIEIDSGESVQNILKDMGHEVAPLPVLSPLAGQAGAVRIHRDHSKSLAHDPRGEGNAGSTG
ncbi:gamma-glutamyltransferase [Pseudooceanicola atlanticus]|uniref:gamma-glutamyltransferase n=1 Tax=Pseudooceanicola atlanticus TaxID=1461694 RepID=UPI0009DEFEAC